MQNVWIIWSPLLYFNFKSFIDPNLLLFIRLECIGHDTGALFSELSIFYKLKGGRIGANFSGETNFKECLNYLVRLSIFQFQKFYGPKFFAINYILMHCAWFMSTFLRVLKILQIKDGRPNFWREPILQKVRIIWSRLLYFSFKSFMLPISSSFIRFKCIGHDTGVPFSKSWTCYKLMRGT